MPDIPITPTGLTISPTTKPLDLKASIEKAVRETVPADKHVAVIVVATEKGARFATAIKVGEHWSIHGQARYTHGDGKPWSGEVGIVGVW